MPKGSIIIRLPAVGITCMSPCQHLKALVIGLGVRGALGGEGGGGYLPSSPSFIIIECSQVIRFPFN